MSRAQRIEYAELINEKAIRRARESLLAFTHYTMADFRPNAFHRTYYGILDDFAKHKLKRLIVTVPPQHGKSEGSSRRLPAYILGREPDDKIAIASYSTPFARKFNRDVQRIIDTPEYNSVFGETKLNRSKVVTITSSELRNADEFEVVGRRGGLKAVGRGGALTGSPVDTLIIDDIYKDYIEGNSPTTLDAAWDWYSAVARTRTHNDSRQLIVFTRWNEADLVGRIEAIGGVVTLDSRLGIYDKRTWYKINFPAIMNRNGGAFDPRGIGEPLWEERHDLASLEEAREAEPEIFESLYQGNPIPREGLLYDSFATYKEIPKEHLGVYNYTDTADTGSDYLCSINYIKGRDGKAYVIGVLYTDAPMEITEPQTAGLLDSDGVSRSKVESNNGGRGFARAVQKIVKGTTISWFHQGKNKEARIYTASARVQRDVVFPENWAIRWPNFNAAMKGYKKKFATNRHDDAPDAVTGIVEDLERHSAPIKWVRG